MINNMTEETKVKMKDYGVKALPTTVIEGKSKLQIGFVEVICLKN
jgi:hypothetical protein